MIAFLIIGILLIAGAVGFSFLPKPKQVTVQGAAGAEPVTVKNETEMEDGIFMVQAEREPEQTAQPKRADLSPPTNTVQAGHGVGVLEQYKASIPLRHRAMEEIATVLQADRETHIRVVAVKRQLMLELNAKLPEPELSQS